ncbi:hypothetical protein RYH80_10885 [Halobaculum sp. MBLA0147]|uniref:hypothetical protein n=1 Tax=Halobaculum sp. MBLA0147 TaxID=3079934 RepID=UPI003526A9FC
MNDESSDGGAADDDPAVSAGQRPDDAGFEWVEEPARGTDSSGDVAGAPLDGAAGGRADDGPPQSGGGPAPGTVDTEPEEFADDERRVGLDDVDSEPLGGWDAVPDDPPSEETIGATRSDDSVETSTTESSPTERAPHPAARGSRSDADAAPSAVPRPPATWRESDPTGARWWRALYRGTQLSALVVLAWSVPLAAFDLTTRLAPGAVSRGTAVAVVCLAVVAVLVRFLVLPVALYRDATLLRRADAVPWEPDRRFYLLVGALAATPTCLYYLYKRGRYVGNPRLRLGGAVVRYESQSVRSNWWVAVAVATVVGPVTDVLGVATGGLSSPVGAVRVAVGGPLLSLTSVRTVVGTFGALPTPVDVAVGAPVLAVGGVVVTLRLAVLPVAFYRDATAVRRSDADWEPLALWYALAGWVFAVPTAVVYLARRLTYTDVSLTGRDA